MPGREPQRPDRSALLRTDPMAEAASNPIALLASVKKPPPGWMPARVKPMSRASLATIRRSAARARLKPAPTATPCAAAIVGAWSFPKRTKDRCIRLVLPNAGSLAGLGAHAPSAGVRTRAERTASAGDHHCAGSWVGVDLVAHCRE